MESDYREELVAKNVSLNFAKKRLRVLVEACRNFHDRVRGAEDGGRELREHEVRAVNDRIQHFEKHFVLMSEVGEQSLKHVVYTTKDNFWGIVHALKENGDKRSGNKKSGDKKSGDKVQKEVTLFVWCVDMATRSLDLSGLRLGDT